MNSRKNLLIWMCVPVSLLLLALASGCGPSLKYTVPQETIQRLPKGSRRTVFQARTVVTIAVDRKASIRRKIEATIQEIEKTKKKIESAKKESSKYLGLELAMLDAKVDFLEDSVKHQETLLELADYELMLAKAQFELAKAKLVKKHSIAFDADIQDFEEQVKSVGEYVQRFKKGVDAEAAELKIEEDKWLAAKKTYYSAIGESSKGWWTEQ
ncbi:MAG: hypothetical protein JXR96_28640 [Deltaproteobacteria bacterium]|nr:hypothetical protein [Deltaproteobacteria bacterium]